LQSCCIDWLCKTNKHFISCRIRINPYRVHQLIKRNRDRFAVCFAAINVNLRYPVVINARGRE
jgi:hypothetical protein